MTEHAWTPGPWEVDAQSNGLALVSGPTYIHADQPYLTVADARLIAAAPEMAEVLTRLVAEYRKEEDEHGFPFNFALRDAHREAVGLLARIEGGG